MKLFISSLSTSDIIQVFGIVTSLITSIIAVTISIKTLRQNSKMIEASSRPVISIYGESINPGTPEFFIVIKNFGASAAYFQKFDYDFDFTDVYPGDDNRDYLKDLQNSVLAPGQSRICALDYSKLDKPVTFDLVYSSDAKTYHDKMTIDLTAGAGMISSKIFAKEEPLRTVSYSLQEMVQKNL